MTTGKDIRVFMTSTSFPKDASDWKATFIRSMVISLAARTDIQLAFWGPKGELPAGVTYTVQPADALWFDRLLADGGIANVLRKKNLKSFLATLSLLRKLRAAYQAGSGATVFHANWLQCALPIGRRNKPLLVTVLGTDYGLLKIPGMVFLLRRVFRSSPCIIAPNADWMVPRLNECFGDVASVKCIPFGIDKEWFEICRAVEMRPRRWLLVSRLTRAKIGALFEWGKGLFGENDELHVFGPMQEDIVVPSWAHYHGPTNPRDLQERHFPTAAGLVTMSRHDEGRPQIMLEAMAAGLPIVASPLSAHLDLVKNNETGLIVDSREDLHIALQKLSDIVENRRLGTNARTWVKTQLGTWDDCAKRYVDAYNSLVAKRP